MSRSFCRLHAACAGRDVEPSSSSSFRHLVSGASAWGISFLVAAMAVNAQTITPRFSETTQGDIRIVGNTLMTCRGGCNGQNQGGQGNNNYTMVYVDIDNDPSTFNSSSADLNLPADAEIRFAGLYWGGRTNDSQRDRVRFSTPASGGYTSINGTILGSDSSSQNAYSAFADVTSLVAVGKSGTYRTANVQARDDDNDLYAGWALVVVFRSPSETARNLVVFDGFAVVENNRDVSFRASGFQTPPAGQVKVKLGAVTFEGDDQLTGDSFRLNSTRLSDATNPSGNFFNSSISTLGVNNTARNPDYRNTLGFDADIIEADGILPNNATQAEITFETDGDVFYPTVATFSTEVYAPAFSSTKRVDFVSGGPGGRPGDILSYTISVSSSGLDDAANTILNDTIPANTTYVPGSLEIISGANSGTKSDGAGDDQAEFDSTNNRVVFRLGTGANGASGGRLAIGQQTTVRFRVRINESAVAGTIIQNIATPITATGQVSGVAISSSSDSNAELDGNQPTNTLIVGAPNLTITKSHTGTLRQAGTVSYTVVVSNIGTAPTLTAVTVSDPMPAGLTAKAAAGPGWSCTLGATVTCTRSDAVAVGASYPPISIVADIAIDAPASITNVVTVSGGADLTPGNNTASDPAVVLPIADLTISKTHAGNFTAGQSGAYAIVVSSLASAGPSFGLVTVSDPMPTGLTATAAAGPGWSCTVGATVTCSRTDILVAGSSFPPIAITVNVAASAPATIVNTVTVSGGSDATPANNTASDTTTILPPPNLSITKTHSGTFAAGQAGSYTVVVSNSPTTGSTNGTVAVSDPMPSGLTATAASGTGWTCTIGPTVTCTRSDALAPGDSYPAIAINVDIAPAAPANIVNIVTVSGGADNSPLNNTASDSAAIIPLPDLSITKSHSGTFAAGQTGSYSIVVSNSASTGPTVGTVTVSDPMPAGLTATAAGGTGWSCTLGATVTCTRSDVLAPGASYPAIVLDVTIAPNAPSVILNVATVSGGADNSPVNNRATDSSVIVPLPDLSITKSHSGLFAAGQVATYTIVVSNAAGVSPVSGTVTVSDPMPAGLTATSASGPGWTCTVGSTVVCTRADGLAAGASYPAITLTADIANSASGVITNIVTVSGGGDTSPANNTASDPALVTSGVDLTITKSHTGDFKVGETGTYVITVTNTAFLNASSGQVTVADTLPRGMTATAATGTGWTCSLGAIVTCSRGDVLAPRASYPPISLSVTLAEDVPSSLTNVALVSGGNDADLTNNTASDPTVIILRPDLSIKKTHTGILVAGRPATYLIQVSNAAIGGPTSGAVTVSDVIPSGLTATAAIGQGWSCAVGPTVTCTRSDVLAPGATYPPINLTVSVDPSAPPLIINTATVTGGGDNTPINNTDSDPGLKTQLPDLTITKTHSGTFTPGQTAVYNIVVSSDASAGPSAGTITVSDPIPHGLTALSAEGIGWTCNIGPTVTCTRLDVLPAGGVLPAINLTVRVALDAPSVIENTAIVSGGGDASPGNNSSTDTTSPAGLPDLTVTKTHTGLLTSGAFITYTVTISNIGKAPTTGTVLVTDPIPDGLIGVSGSGSGWTCDVSVVPYCMRSDPLAPGASYPPITIETLVSSAPPLRLMNTVYVSGGGDRSPGNNRFSDGSLGIDLPAADLSILKTHVGDFTAPKIGAVYNIVVSNGLLKTPTFGDVRVTDPMPQGLTATSASGPGWLCFAGVTVVCTRGDSLPANSSYPPITLVVDIAAGTPSPIVNTATVSGGGDTDRTNDQSTDIADTVSLPNLTIFKSHSGSFAPGQYGVYSIAVSNLANTGPTIGAVSVTDPMPGGLTAVTAEGTGWACTVGPSVICTRGDTLQPGASYPAISLTVRADPAVPPVIVNTATVTGGGDITPQNNTASDSTSFSSGPDLTIAKWHTGTFTAGQTGTYMIEVSNSDSGGSAGGTITVRDVMPSGLTATSASGPGWSCTVGPTVVCTRTDTLSPGASFPIITLRVNIASTAPATLTNIAVVSGGGDTSPANNTATDVADIIAAAPDLTISKRVTGPLVRGRTGAYTIVVSNAVNSVTTKEPVTVSDTVPAGLTATSAAGTGWACTVGAAVTCGRSDALAPGASYPPITLGVEISATAPDTVINTAVVSGGGDGFPANNTATDTSPITGGPDTIPDLTITKIHTGNFVPGQGGAYTITVTNVGGVPTSGAVSVADPIPPGIVATSVGGDGWACTLGSTIGCTRNDVLASNASYPPIAIAVNILANAPPVITNIATVSGGGDSSPANNTATDSTSVSPGSNLLISKSHTGSIVPGGNVTYQVVVSNAPGGGPTVGLVTVGDTMSPGLTAVSATGDGWACTTATTVVCTRSDVLAPGASYPPIFIAASVAPDAPSTVINAAGVDGGGDLTPAFAIDPGVPVRDTCLDATTTPPASLNSNGEGIATIRVSNPGTSPTEGTVHVIAVSPSFAPPVAASGAGWQCAINGNAVSCSRSDSLAPGASYPIISITLQLANAPAGITGLGVVYVANSSCSRPTPFPVPPLPPPPSLFLISLVTNGASFITPGHTNYGIAPGSFVSIFGRGIGPVVPVAKDSLPLDPAGFAGVQVQVAVGAAVVNVPVVFASSSQLNVMLPSQTPVGEGTLRVTFGGRTTEPYPIRVAATNVGIFTPNRQGFGPAASQNASDNGLVIENTLLTPARPGQVVELWATGLGAVQGNEMAGPLPGALDVPVEIYVGGKRADAIYSGRSGCCIGTDQIHFVVPDGVQGCNVPVFVRAAGNMVSNTVTLAISTQSPCVEPGSLTSQQLDHLRSGGAVPSATVSLNRTAAASAQNFALAEYRQVNLLSVLASELDFPLPPVNSCTVGQSRRDGKGLAPVGPLYVPALTQSIFPLREHTPRYLNGGNPVLTRGAQTQPLTADIYFRYSTFAPVSTFLDPGMVGFSNVEPLNPFGAYSTSVNLPSGLQFVGWQQPGLPEDLINPEVIDRQRPLVVRWTGGDPVNDYAVISGFKSETSLGSGTQGITATTWFVCTAPADAQTFVVPSEVMQAFPSSQSYIRVPWIPGGHLSDTTATSSSLSVGSVRKPGGSLFSGGNLEYGRLFYVLTMQKTVNYR